MRFVSHADCMQKWLAKLNLVRWLFDLKSTMGAVFYITKPTYTFDKSENFIWEAQVVQETSIFVAEQ